MHGLVSLLPAPYYEQVLALWRELEDEISLHGIRVTPHPHFSWQIAREYQLEELEGIIRRLAGSIAPFTVRTTGIGLFSGPRPVIYISVVKDKTLLNLHEQIWGTTQPAGQGVSLHYSPQSWMPHISLAYEDLDADNLPRAVNKLAFRSFNWEMTIDNIALVYEPEGQTGGLHFRYELTGN